MTTSADILAGLAASKPRVRRIADVPGFPGAVYVRSSTVAETLAVSRVPVPPGMERDPFALARRYAISLCDADGNRLFDATDDEAMEPLQVALDGASFDIANGLIEAANKGDEPIATGDAAEVDAAGN